MSNLVRQKWTNFRSRWTARSRRENADLQKFSTVIDQIAENVVITNRMGVIEYVNPAFERMTGYTRNEVIGRNPSLLKSGRHEPAVYETLWKTILAGEVYHDVLINRKKNGELYDEEKIITPIIDKHGRITHFVSSGRDISERRRTEENLKNSERRLREVNAIRNDFFSMVVHELNSPLASVSGCVELLTEEASDPHMVQYQEYLTVARRNIERIRRLLKDLVDVARVERGKFTVTRARTDIRACVLEACLSVEDRIRAAGLQLFTPPESLPPVMTEADAERLEQVVVNLVENAIRYAATFVRVDVSDSSASVVITVENDGPAILNPDNLGRIFDIHTQIETPGKSKGVFGLGLPIAKGIVEAHGGQIRAENLRSNDGSGQGGATGVRFSATLPRT